MNLTSFINDFVFYACEWWGLPIKHDEGEVGKNANVTKNMFVKKEIRCQVNVFSSGK